MILQKRLILAAAGMCLALSMNLAAKGTDPQRGGGRNGRPVQIAKGAGGPADKGAKKGHPIVSS